MKNLLYFQTKPFITALREFFEELHVPVSYFSESRIDAREILSTHYKNNDVFKVITDVYVLGLVNDAAFANQKSDIQNEKEAKAVKEDYEGLLITGVVLNNLSPSRSALSDITRAFNRAFPFMPVAVIFKYGNFISFANSERAKYKQEWREGEKVGKISLLKDVSILSTHRGHLAILSQLEIPVSGSRAVRSFTQLYYYWQSVFSISVLNKTFYQEIIAWFNRAIKDIKIPSESAESDKHKDFTVRLIARLIFIWFLKELKVVKEELLVPEFDNGIANDLIKPKSKGTSYYKFVLQNLFFNALNSERKSRDTDVFDVYASDFTDEDAIKEAIFFSPYLNGGLFDIQKENDWCDIDSKTKIYKVNNAFSVPDSLFLHKGIGLNAILSRYKFTIAENTPLEEEIAVDPEMLGRIFENLLAEQSDDTKDVARKNAGAFYTPRPVVSYMCRSTLLKHLDIAIIPENSKIIIRKILETTVLDPACGSGAFPMGMLEEMMDVLSTVDPEGKVWVAEMLKSKDEQFREHVAEMYADGQIRYIKKLGLLRSCLFGVDKLDYAIEITKLRCWLSLIVEQRVDFGKDNYNLKPLPNLEFKFYKKDSLFRFYQDKNLNDLIDVVDNEQLLKELVNLENQYFITKSDRLGTKEEIKEKIVRLLEKVVDRRTEEVQKSISSVRYGINKLVSSGATEKEIARLRKQEKAHAEELANLAIFRKTIKDYFIERVVFPGIFNKENKNPGFDIVVGNPPYVNTKLISSMGIGTKLEEEYGYKDDLYNHFTFRGLELLKSGGVMSYITSDTFLTLQSKRNMRMLFLGIPKSRQMEGQAELFEQFETETSKKDFLPECVLTEIINTPKAFSALVDTAIFSLKKERPNESIETVYVDLRRPNADTLGISEQEWKQIKESKENLAGWERVLDKTFSALGHKKPKWVAVHECDGDSVLRDNNSTLLKFKLSVEPYRKAINYAIFSPTEYNCQILEKIIKPARPVFDAWWNKIETSRQIENNRSEIRRLNSKLKPSTWSIVGLITDGGVGLQTGDNGRFVGYRSSSRFAERCRQTRIEKLWKAISDEPKIKKSFELLATCKNVEDVKDVLDELKEVEVWQLFDRIRDKFDLKSKGFIYRIIPDNMVFDVSAISNTQKLKGIKGKRSYVPYDKGDKEGNRWYLRTQYLIDWSEESVSILSTDKKARWQGYSFFFRNGFCWNDVLNPNSSYIKCRLKGQSVNDVKSMSLYDECGLGDKFLVTLINSYLGFKVLREFLNNTVAIQINDIRKFPIKIPSEKELKLFNKKFDECLAIKEDYFAEEITRPEMLLQLKPVEAEIDEMVNRFYGIEIKEVVQEESEEMIEVEEVEEED